MAIWTLLSVPGMALRRPACSVLCPVTPPPCAQYKIRTVKKLGSRQTPSKRSTDQHKPKKGRKRGLKFHRDLRKEQRPPLHLQHLPYHLPHWPHPPHRL